MAARPRFGWVFGVFFTLQQVAAALILFHYYRLSFLAGLVVANAAWCLGVGVIMERRMRRQDREEERLDRELEEARVLFSAVRRGVPANLWNTWKN